MSAESWKCQGRQDHGWFGDGTCPKCDNQDIEYMAYGAVGTLARSLSRPYESWLTGGGMKTLLTLVPAWAKDATLSPDAFSKKYFGDLGSTIAVGFAQAIAQKLIAAPTGAKGDATRQQAALELANLVTQLRPEGLSKALAPGLKSAVSADVPPEYTEQNVQDLARIIQAEAGGQPDPAPTAVGFTVLNRMRQNKLSSVQNIKKGYATTTAEPSEKFIVVAGEILGGAITDPTNGATHFYTPQIMPKEGATPSERAGVDIAGGLESVPGVTDHGKPVRNFRPHYATVYPQIKISGIADDTFKFYRSTDKIAR